jgi:hypothetical protein
MGGQVQEGNDRWDYRSGKDYNPLNTPRAVNFYGHQRAQGVIIPTGKRAAEVRVREEKETMLKAEGYSLAGEIRSRMFGTVPTRGLSFVRLCLT